MGVAMEMLNEVSGGKVGTMYLKRALLTESLADEATFQIARTLNRSRADSEAARRRWWRVYSASPGLYRDAARRIVEARSLSSSLNWGGTTDA